MAAGFFGKLLGKVKQAAGTVGSAVTGAMQKVGFGSGSGGAVGLGNMGLTRLK